MNTRNVYSVGDRLSNACLQPPGAPVSNRRPFLSVFLLLIFCAVSAESADVKVDKQKLKLALDYETFVGTQGTSISTSGAKVSYLLKGGAVFGKKLYVDFDLQSGAKTNLVREFDQGDLSPLILSNRAVVNVTIPFGKAYIGGSLYHRNKWVAGGSNVFRFVDIFGGQGFHETTGTASAGYSFNRSWRVSGSAHATRVNFFDFPLSGSSSQAASARVTHRLRDINLNFDYRYRSIDYRRPVFSVDDFASGGLPLQNDKFWEAGAGIEMYRHFYFSAGYYYQDNDSNNPGFSYSNHRMNLVIGTELPQEIYLQAYGIIRHQDFRDHDPVLQYPIFVEESDNNTMAASLIKSLSEHTELELGFQRLTNNSSFSELDAAKNNFYIAYNYRW